MTLRQQLSAYIIQATPYLFVILTAVLAWLGKKASAWLTAHTKLMNNALVVGFLSRLDIAVTQAVQAVEQTTVKPLQAKTGTVLTEADALQARDEAIALIKRNLGGAVGVAKIQEIIGVPDVEAYLASVVAAKVQQLNPTAGTVAVTSLPAASAPPSSSPPRAA